MKYANISAKHILEDIRAGVDEESLLQKYQISKQTLKKLFTDLANAKFIKYLNAREIVIDIRSGMDNQALMDKYDLSPAGLQNLFKSLDRAGLLQRISVDKNHAPTKVVVNIHQILEDIRLGLAKVQLMQKYRLSPRGLRWISKTLANMGSISLKEVHDKLHITVSELFADKARQTKRYSIPFNCWVYESGNPGTIGKVRDLSENGLGIAGLNASLGDEKSLVIQGDEFGEFAGFTFEGICRWMRKDSKGVSVTGFEISNIAVGSRREFELMFRLAEFCNRDKLFY